MTIALAQIKPAMTQEHRLPGGTRVWHYYSSFKQTDEFVDLGSVNQLVGRVQSIKRPNRTYIIDRGTPASRVDLILC